MKRISGSELWTAVTDLTVREGMDPVSNQVSRTDELVGRQVSYQGAGRSGSYSITPTSSGWGGPNGWRMS